jgi:hypothetical protein
MGICWDTAGMLLNIASWKALVTWFHAWISHNVLEGLSPGFGDGVFTACYWDLAYPSCQESRPTRCQWTCWSNRGTHPSWCTGEQVSVAQRNLEKAQEQIAHQTGKNLGSNIRPAPKWQKGSLITSWSHPSETMTPGPWDQVGNIWCLPVNVCEWQVAWLQSKSESWSVGLWQTHMV